MNKTIIFLFIIFANFAAAFLNPLKEHTASGNKRFERGQYADALSYYYKAQSEDPVNPEVLYNIANTLTKIGKHSQAISNYEKALLKAQKPLKADVYYNMARTHYNMKHYKKAVEGFKKSLYFRPGDKNALYNLELARKKLRENSNKQKHENRQNSQEKKSGDNRNKQNHQDQNKTGKNSQDQSQNRKEPSKDQSANPEKSKQKSDRKKSGKQNSGNKQNKDQKSSPGSTKKAKKISKEEAEQILKAMEKNAQKPKQYFKFNETIPPDPENKNW